MQGQWIIDVTTNQVKQWVDEVKGRFPSEGDKIARIKELRSMTEFGLKEAKDLIEAQSWEETREVVTEIMHRSFNINPEPKIDRHIVMVKRGYSGNAWLAFQATNADEANRVREFVQELGEIVDVAKVLP